ncbi:MAG: NADH:ubiquinone oxidoreductase, partial [Candidatus Dormibacteraeota bacterium]|nr:NADH:ubiquinone oxidoreductase [Candidatus Dormibacteraeota bacterium]MBO0761345.1 NADH:ubiquinone oxidoreductase [Candidatus Dormibacteraeota bacterium]
RPRPAGGPGAVRGGVPDLGAHGAGPDRPPRPGPLHPVRAVRRSVGARRAAVRPRLRAGGPGPGRPRHGGDRAVSETTELEGVRRGLLARTRGFGRSLFLRHVDAGSDGAAESEILALANPYYDLQRLGFFFTASPRHADVLLVTGGVTRALEPAVRATIDLTPEPRAILAVGAAACGGGIEGVDATLGGVDRLVPVDVYVPGDPPSPLTLLHGLLLAVDRVGQALRFRSRPAGRAP